MTLLLLAIILLILIFFAVSGPMGAPWVPARQRDLQPMLDTAKLKAGDVFIELGCGDGRMLAAAARRGAKIIGYEINPLMWLVAKIRLLGYKTATVKLANFWKADLSKADVVMVFSMPKFMPKIEAKTTKELKSGARLISYVFALPNKKPTVKTKSWQIYKFK